MIPKIIHYCWFGGKEKPEDIVGYIETWKKYLPDYTLVEWNENNFDINSNLYVKQAYENKKWAFVSDYVRIYALYHKGGVYMDTDVEVIKNLDIFLKHDGFTGFETINGPLTGTMGAVPGEKIMGDFLDEYKERRFITENGSLDMTTNVEIFRKICLRNGFIMNNQFQVIDGFALYPNEYFCPFDFVSEKFVLTENTYTIHHFSGSWVSRSDRIKRNLMRPIKHLLGAKVCHHISDFRRKKRFEKQ